MHRMWIKIGDKMFLNNIKIKNFRNYENQEIKLEKNINIFYGDNAQGKTNILESIFLCAFGKSFRTNKEKEMIKKGENFSNIEIEYEKKDRKGNIKINLSDKKIISLNGIKIKKLSELLGNINLVIFTPDDINLLKEGPAIRRKFLDMMIGQLRTNYVNIVNLYIKTLEQRNNYLKQFKIEEKMLDIWDEKLADYGYKIYQYRQEYIEKIKSKIEKIHSEIANEKIKIEYVSDCKDKKEYIKKLLKNRKLDKIKGYTTSGIHRDDFKIFINNEEVNIYGSQGQNRTAILSLKLAELQVIYDEIGEYPILLLDDFMSELDEKRISNFLKNIGEIQVIITCTKNIKIQNSISYKIESGKIIK